MQQRINWRNVQEMFRESTWITIAWEWLQKLLVRAVDLVLWITMIYSGYQLIPGVPQASVGVSSFMFIAQFIALDIGGLGLNQLAQQQNLPRWAYARVVAYILIGITLVTITYSGLHHAIPTIPDEVNTGVEITLVIMRAAMTIFYGQAIRSLKVVEHSIRDRLAALEAEAPALRNQASSVQQQLSSVQSQASTLQKELDGLKQEASSLRQQLDTEKRRSAEMQHELETGHGDTASLRRELNTAQVLAETLQAQLNGKKQELASLRETLESGQGWQESRVRQMVETEQQRVLKLQREVNDEQTAAGALRRQLNASSIEVDALCAQLEGKTREVESLRETLDEVQDAAAALRQQVGDVEGLRGHLGVKQQEVESVRAMLASEQHTVSTLRLQLDAEQQRVSTLRQRLDGRQVVQVSTGQEEMEGGQGKVVRLDTRRTGQDGAESAIAEQIRQLLKEEPGLSGRAIATRLSCSPTTANRWKGIIEQQTGQTSTECVNE